MSLGLRRFLLVILSLVGGVAGLLLVWATLNLVYDARITLERYGVSYAIFTAIPLALFCAVWLDYFMGTGLLPEGPDESVTQAAPKRGGRAASSEE